MLPACITEHFDLVEFSTLKINLRPNDWLNFIRFELFNEKAFGRFGTQLEESPSIFLDLPFGISRFGLV